VNPRVRRSEIWHPMWRLVIWPRGSMRKLTVVD
jgi:hypothetical protein